MRSRSSVVLSLPVLLFACLVLATNARAQDSVVFQLEDANTHSLFQAFINRQQAPLNTEVPRAGLQVMIRSSTLGTMRPDNISLLPLPAPETGRKITPGQCFGNGAQAAP